MSVGVCVSFQRGIVLSMDSRRMVHTGGPGGRFDVDTDRARKLFQLDERFAVATHGEATVGGRPIDDVLGEFTGPAGETTAVYAEALGEFVAAALDAVTQPRRGDLVTADALRWPIGFVVAGFDRGVGRVYEVSVRARDCELREMLSTEEPGVNSFGLNDGIDRLLLGFDRDALQEAGISIDPNDEKLRLLSYELIIPEDIEGATALSHSLIEVQLLAQQISWGTYASSSARVPGCGGEILTLAVTRDGVVSAAAPTPAPARRGLRRQAGEAPRRARQSA